MAKKETKNSSDPAGLLGPDGVSDSPLPDFPGTLRMPLVMTLSMHKRWQAYANAAAAAERDATDVRVGIAFMTNDEAEANERLPFLYDDVKLGLMFGKMLVTHKSGGVWTEETPADELPLPVAAWVAKVYREWEDSQLLFRWHRHSGVAASGSAD